MKRLGGILSFLFLLTALTPAVSQIYDPVKWKFSAEKQSETEYTIILKASVEKGWHLYSQHLGSQDGPIPTSFQFKKSADYSLVGKVDEGKSIKKYDPNFEMDLNFFENSATFKQKIKIENGTAAMVKGTLEYMVCNDEMCLPPELVDFSVQCGEKTADQETGEEPTDEDSATAVQTDQENPQLQDPVKIAFDIKDNGNGEYTFIAKVKIEEGWHFYSQTLPSEDGPVATEINFKDNTEFQYSQLAKEIGEMKTEFDPQFEMDLNFYENEVIFEHTITRKDASVSKLEGEVYYMVCNAEMCLPPTPAEFVIDFDKLTVEEPSLTLVTAVNGKIDYDDPNIDLDNPVNDCGDKREEHSLWGIFLLGMIGGFIALLTPCVFPMIPLTVSFFTKGSQGAKGVRRSITYGFFIALIYFLLSTPFHLIPDIDPEVLNQISTNTWLNLIFFAIFIAFALSFFGYYEITLPNKWGNKADTAANVGGGFGIFFMALTLAIVSFSCTGPILGSLLAGTLDGGAGVTNVLGMELQTVAVKLTLGMTGFGLALGLPFALFAMFPRFMEALPSSGGWLNSVKVVLGFVEVALAIKFLSNADLVEQWGLLKRETFFALWFVIGLATVLYLLGKIKFPHDSKVERLSPVRIGFVVLFASFTIYLLPGIFNGKWWEHNLLSGFPPPKYYSYAKHEHEIRTFMDYNEGLAVAAKEGKPVMLDFTGWACVNCRKMEDNVWVEDEIKQILTEKYVVISLYVDEKTKLAEEDQEVISVPTADGGTKKKKITTVGQRWSTLETLTYGNNTQPLYALISPDRKLLTNPVGYTPEVGEYKDFLECGLNAYDKVNSQTAEK